MPTEIIHREAFFFPSARRVQTTPLKLAKRVATTGTHEAFGMSPRYHHWNQQRQNAPYRMDLADVLPDRSAAIQRSGKIVFHMVGDTGAAHNPGAQQNIADHMADQVKSFSYPCLRKSDTETMRRMSSRPKSLRFGTDSRSRSLRNIVFLTGDSD